MEPSLTPTPSSKRVCRQSSFEAGSRYSYFPGYLRIDGLPLVLKIFCGCHFTQGHSQKVALKIFLQSILQYSMITMVKQTVGHAIESTAISIAATLLRCEQASYDTDRFPCRNLFLQVWRHQQDHLYSTVYLVAARQQQPKLLTFTNHCAVAAALGNEIEIVNISVSIRQPARAFGL